MSIKPVRLPSMPRKAGKPALPSRKRGPEAAVAPDAPQVDAAILDEYGLGAWADGTPDISRYYIRVAYDHFQFDGKNPPSFYFGPGQGTIPELVVFGFLLEEDFEPNEWSSRGFIFQAYALGGRSEAGGAVVDFEVHHYGRVIGVRVNSVFHALDNPYGGGAAVWENNEQRLRLLADGYFDNVIDVNINRELEAGNDATVEQDLNRILVA